MSIFSGRMGRRAFVGVYVCFVVVQTAIALATSNKLLAGAVCFVPWIWMASRRLHDFNARWWWALTPVLIDFVAGFVRGYAVAARAETLNVVGRGLTATQIDWTYFADHPLDFLVSFARGFASAAIPRLMAHPIEFTLQLAFLLVLVSWPGTPGSNRFGDLPGRKPNQVTEVFD
jgi:uncharacterized membrane protein YhaH (DUF805 family)